MTLKATATGWDTTDWIRLHHEGCVGTWRVSVGSVFCRLQVRCPQCNETDYIEPHELVAVFLRGTPPLSAEEACIVDEAAATRTMGWYAGLAGLEEVGALAEYHCYPFFLAP